MSQFVTILSIYLFVCWFIYISLSIFLSLSLYIYIYIYIYIHIYPTPPLGQDMTQGEFLKRGLTGLNSEFSFS